MTPLGVTLMKAISKFNMCLMKDFDSTVLFLFLPCFRINGSYLPTLPEMAVTTHKDSPGDSSTAKGYSNTFVCAMIFNLHVSYPSLVEPAPFERSILPKNFIVNS